MLPRADACGVCMILNIAIVFVIRVLLENTRFLALFVARKTSEREEGGGMDDEELISYLPVCKPSFRERKTPIRDCTWNSFRNQQKVIQ